MNNNEICLSTNKEFKKIKTVLHHKMSFVGCAVIVILLEIIVLYHVKTAYHSAWKALPETTTKAGNYYRNSDIYNEFVNYVKEHGTVSAEDDIEITYNLDKKDVIAWGAPGNRGNFEVQYSDIDDFICTEYSGFINEDNDKVYNKESSTVTIQKFGGSIITRFNDQVDYDIGNDIIVRVNYDYISNNVTGMCYISEKDNTQAFEEFFKGVDAISHGQSEELNNKEDWKQRILKGEQYDTFLRGDEYCNVTYSFEEGKLYQYIFPSLKDE